MGELCLKAEKESQPFKAVSFKRQKKQGGETCV